MQVRAFKAEGFAQLSYLISEGTKAIVVDPHLDIGTYLNAAEGLGVKICFVLETHRSLDFVSGGQALAELLYIPIYHGVRRDCINNYTTAVEDGDVLHAGKLKVTVLETPGHTKDSVCYQVANTRICDKTEVIFTGRTLFARNAGHSGGSSGDKAHISSVLFQSLNKLIHLPNHVVVYPAYGAGSVCGSELVEREFSTLGYEKQCNPRLQIGTHNNFAGSAING